MSADVRRRLVVSGHVQGVSFRDWLVREAGTLGVAGWVRNRDDGSVEAVVEGPPAAVSAIVERVRRGPPAARVERVTVADADRREPLKGFVRRPTD